MELTIIKSLSTIGMPETAGTFKTFPKNDELVV